MLTIKERRKEVAVYLESEYSKWEQDHDESRLDSMIKLFESNMPQLIHEENNGGWGSRAFLDDKATFTADHAVHMLEELNNYVLYDEFNPRKYDISLLIKIRQSIFLVNSYKDLDPHNLVYFLLLVDYRIFQDNLRDIELVNFNLIVEHCMYAIRLRQRYGPWWDM